MPDINFDAIFKFATRTAVKIKILLAGVAGSGKTMGALLLARGLAGSWDKIIFIDTENSAALYAHLGNFRIAIMGPPFEPERFIKVIELAIQAGATVIVIDSITAEWEEVLNIQTKLGGRYTDWAKTTPRHNAFLDKIRTADAHIICTARKKSDYSIEESGGKKTIKKVGLKEIAREGTEYEFTLAFDIGIDHLANASKDRTSLFMDRTPFIINEKTGEEILKWCNG